MNKKLIIAIIAFVFLPVSSFAKGLEPYKFTEEEQLEIEKIDELYRSYTSIKSKFTQHDTLGNNAVGWFVIQRPGKSRIEYENIPVSLIANSGTLLLFDSKLNQKSFIPLKGSPFAHLLSDKVSLFSDEIIIVDYLSAENHSEISIRSSDFKEVGYLTLIIEKETGAIIGWNVFDSQGVETKILLIDAKFSKNEINNQRLFNTQRVVTEINYENIQ